MARVELTAQAPTRPLPWQRAEQQARVSRRWLLVPIRLVRFQQRHWTTQPPRLQDAVKAQPLEPNARQRLRLWGPSQQRHNWSSAQAACWFAATSLPDDHERCRRIRPLAALPPIRVSLME